MRTTLKRRYTMGLIATLILLATLPAVAAEEQAELMLYRVQSPGEEPYFNRLLANPAFLRLDRGGQDSGYILYDRQQQIIYSVNHEEHSILVIDPPPMTDDLSARMPEIELKSVAPVSAPSVSGVKPQQWVLTSDGQRCREAFVLPGLMPKAVAAYGEYLKVLAQQQALALSTMPAEFQDACDQAVHVYAPDSLLRKGLPLNVWNGKGYREVLIDFREGFRVSKDDFRLPTDYSRIPMGTGF